MAVNYIVSLGCMGVNVGYYLFAYSLIRLQASSNLFILGWWLYVFARSLIFIGKDLQGEVGLGSALLQKDVYRVGNMTVAIPTADKHSYLRHWLSSTIQYCHFPVW
jgi:hypothetical protein